MANPSFPGFDGNNEGEYSSIASVLIKDLDKYPRLKVLNSHMPIVDAYRRMLSVFKPMRNANGPGDLSVGQLIEILKAQIHPSNSSESRASAIGPSNT